eukprot:2730075-Rhodomonas_salina.1
MCLVLNHTYFVNWWFIDDELYVFCITLTVTLVRTAAVFYPWLWQFHKNETITHNLTIVVGLIFVLWSFISTLEHYDAVAALALSASERVGPQLNQWTTSTWVYSLVCGGFM